MSSAGEGSRDWRFYVTDMIEFADVGTVHLQQSIGPILKARGYRLCSAHPW